MFILAFAFIGQNEKFKKLVKKLGIIGFFVFLVVRVYLMAGAPGAPIKAINEMIGWEDEIALLQKEANGRPVVFHETYQKASFYAFHANQPYTTYAMLSGFYKYSQFDLYPTENKIQGQDVLFVSMDSSLMKNNVRHIKGDIKNWYLRDIPNFNSYNMLEIDTDPGTFVLENRTLEVPEITIRNPYSRIVELEKNPQLQAHLRLYVRGERKWEQVSEVDMENLKIAPGETISLKNIRFHLPDSLSGEQLFFLGLQNGPFRPVHSHVEFFRTVD